MAENFEVYLTLNNGASWSLIQNTIAGTHPCGDFTSLNIVFCFYCSENGAQIDLVMETTFNLGASWTDPVTIIADINEGGLGFSEEHGVISVSYFKNDIPYVIHSYNAGASFTDPIEVAL